MADSPLSGRRGAQVPGADHVGLPPVEVTDELRDRRAAVAELGAELRVLADLVTRTEVDADALRDSARRLREVTPALRERIRSIAEPASVDDLMGGVRMFNPVIGAGNPIAPPLRLPTAAPIIAPGCHERGGPGDYHRGDAT